MLATELVQIFDVTATTRYQGGIKVSFLLEPPVPLVPTAPFSLSQLLTGAIDAVAHNPQLNLPIISEWCGIGRSHPSHLLAGYQAGCMQSAPCCLTEQTRERSFSAKRRPQKEMTEGFKVYVLASHPDWS